VTVIHDLKTAPVYFDAVERGEKTFEIRRDDRGFQKGDTVRLFCFDPVLGYRMHSTGWHMPAKPIKTAGEPCGGYAQIIRRIAWILTGGQLGLEPGFVILALAPVEGDPVIKGTTLPEWWVTPWDELNSYGKSLVRDWYRRHTPGLIDDYGDPRQHMPVTPRHERAPGRPGAHNDQSEA
jgi:hypothetical protein